MKRMVLRKEGAAVAVQPVNAITLDPSVPLPTHDDIPKTAAAYATQRHTRVKILELARVLTSVFSGCFEKWPGAASAFPSVTRFAIPKKGSSGITVEQNVEEIRTISGATVVCSELTATVLHHAVVTDANDLIVIVTTSKVYYMIRFVYYMVSGIDLVDDALRSMLFAITECVMKFTQAKLVLECSVLESVVSHALETAAFRYFEQAQAMKTPGDSQAIDALIPTFIRVLKAKCDSDIKYTLEMGDFGDQLAALALKAADALALHEYNTLSVGRLHNANQIELENLRSEIEERKEIELQIQEQATLAVSNSLGIAVTVAKQIEGFAEKHQCAIESLDAIADRLTVASGPLAEFAAVKSDEARVLPVPALRLEKALDDPIDFTPLRSARARAVDDGGICDPFEMVKSHRTPRTADATSLRASSVELRAPVPHITQRPVTVMSGSLSRRVFDVSPLVSPSPSVSSPMGVPLMPTPPPGGKPSENGMSRGVLRPIPGGLKRDNGSRRNQQAADTEVARINAAADEHAAATLAFDASVATMVAKDGKRHVSDVGTLLDTACEVTKAALDASGHVDGHIEDALTRMIGHASNPVETKPAPKPSFVDQLVESGTVFADPPIES